MRYARHLDGIEGRHGAVEAEVKGHRGIEGARLRHLDRAAAAADSAGAADSGGALKLIDADAQRSLVQSTRQQGARNTPRCLPGKRPQHVRLGYRMQIALHSDIQIVFQSERQSVGQRQFQLAVMNQIAETRGVLERKRHDGRLTIGFEHPGEPIGSLAIVGQDRFSSGDGILAAQIESREKQQPGEQGAKTHAVGHSASIRAHTSVRL